MEAELIGRDEELQRVQRFLEAVPAGGRALLIAGEAGVGKTSLWQAAVARAQAAGMRVIAARPTEAETSFAHAALGDLLGPHPEVLENLPGPQRRALEVALLLAERDEKPDQQAVALATLAGLRALARAAPLIVAVDDVQWLDRPSAAVLGFAARRLTDEPIGLLLAQRTAGAAQAPLDLDRTPAIASTTSSWPRSASAPSSASSSAGSAGSPPARCSIRSTSSRAGTRSSRSSSGGRYRRDLCTCSPANGSR